MSGAERKRIVIQMRTATHAGWTGEAFIRLTMASVYRDGNAPSFLGFVFRIASDELLAACDAQSAAFLASV